jgi:hypothetical protein
MGVSVRLDWLQVRPPFERVFRTSTREWTRASRTPLLISQAVPVARSLRV